VSSIGILVAPHISLEVARFNEEVWYFIVYDVNLSTMSMTRGVAHVNLSTMSMTRGVALMRSSTYRVCISL
jgi:hypothetical protein